MAGRIKLEIVTPERVVVQDEADIVVAPGTEGEFGVLINHIPFLTSLKTGEMYYRKGNQTEYLAITGGYAEILPNQVTVLAEAAERAREIDIDRARRAMERAKERLRQAKKETREYARAESALSRAILRLKVTEKRTGA